MKRTRLASALACLALAATAAVTGVGPAAADPGRCNGWTTHPDRYSAGGVSFGAGTALRRGPYLDCDANGRAYPGQRIDVHCGVYNGSGVAWVWVRNLTTGVSGWARTDALRGAGRIPNCY